jgi:hypothetical protein
VGGWLGRRRDALIDAAILYCLSRWLIPDVVSWVGYLASTPAGRDVLLALACPPALAAVVVLAWAQCPPLTGQSAGEGYEWVYVERYRPFPAPHLGGHFVRVPCRTD